MEDKKEKERDKEEVLMPPVVSSGGWERTRKEWKSMLGLLVGRSFVSAGFSMVMLSSPQLLLEINGKDHVAAQRASSRVETINTLAGFLIRPMIGGLIDSKGRVPALVFGPLLSAFARTTAVLYPSNATYILYRVLNLVAMIPLMQGFTASLADRLGGRGSDEYDRFNKFSQVWLAFVRMVALDLTRKIKDKKVCFLLASFFNVCAALIFTTTVKESLRDDQRKPFVFRKAANPFSFISFFSQNKELQYLALLNLIASFHWYNNTHEFYRRGKFNWTIKEVARLAQINSILEVVSPLYSLPITQYLGRKKTAIMAQFMFVLSNLNMALTKRSSTLLLNPFLNSIFDENAMDILNASAAESVHAGQGQLSAALMNLKFPLGLTLPNFFTRLYTWSFKWKNMALRGSAPFLLCAFLHLVTGAYLLPKAWDAIEHHGQKKNDDKKQL